MDNNPQINTPPLNQNPSMHINFAPENKPSRKKLLIIGGITIIVIICVTLITFFALSQSKKTVAKIEPTPTPSQSNTKETALPAPKFIARKYTYSGNLPAKPNLSTYTLAQFTQEDAGSMSAKLGLTTYNSESPEGYFEYTNLEDDKARGIIDFNATSGTFLYQSYGSFIPETFKSGQSYQNQAFEIMKYLGLYDDTITCDITYNQTENPGVTYVECHRDWNKLSAPLLNLGGVLNIPETVKISSLYPGLVNQQISMPNPTITNVSNGGNGLARPREFNTITFGLYENGAISTIDSTMRKISRKNSIDESEIITPKEAVDAIAAQLGESTLTIPSGQGTPGYEKMYPNNLAKTEIAAIYEITPAFIDKPFNEPQASYEPYYLVRGVARLESGYNVRFTQIIPAEKSKTNLTQKISEQNPIQIGTFQPSVFPDSPTPLTSNPTSVISPTQNTNQACQPIITSSLRSGGLIEVPGYGTVRLTFAGENSARTYSFAMPQIVPTQAMVNAVKSEYFKAVGKSLAIHQAKTNQSPLPQNLERRPDCTVDPINRCINNSGINTMLQSKENMLRIYSVDELKTFSYPVPIDIILNPGNFTGTSQGQLLSWLFMENYSAASRENTKTTGNGTIPTACYISGNSPHIFISSKKNREISIKTKAKLSYSDPVAENNVWIINTKNNMFINQQGVIRSSIYYEYDPEHVDFSESKEGYIATRTDISKIVRAIADKLGLTQLETQALLSDTKNALIDLPNSEYIKISIINEDEINTKLPLEISPKPKIITRFHLMLSVAKSSDKTEAPIIQKATRTDYSVLELGAYAKR